MSKGTNLGSRTKTGTDLWIYLTEPTPVESAGSSYALLAACNGTPPTTANVFKHGCLMFQMDSGTGNGAMFENTGSSAVPSWTLLTTFTGGPASQLADTNSATALDTLAAVAPVNNLRVGNAATGAAPNLSAVGTDANIGIRLLPKGTGVISLSGTGAKTTTQEFNYIASETGANNAIAGALLNSDGSAVALAAGLQLVVKLGHTLQAGANTFNLNGGGAVNIKSHFNVSNNIATAYAATGIITLLYDGTEWLDMAQ